MDMLILVKLVSVIYIYILLSAGCRRVYIQEFTRDSREAINKSAHVLKMYIYLGLPWDIIGGRVEITREQYHHEIELDEAKESKQALNYSPTAVDYICRIQRITRQYTNQLQDSRHIAINY